MILFHYIPAIFIDIIIFLTGNKPFLIRVHQKVNNGIGLIQYYTTKEWEFR